jgi:hypothetical protein
MAATLVTGPTEDRADRGGSREAGRPAGSGLVVRAAAGQEAPAAAARRGRDGDSLTAKGLITGEVQAHLAEVYGTDVSRETLSKITDGILEEMTDWLNRPLERSTRPCSSTRVVVKIRYGQVTNRPAYTASRSPPTAPETSSGLGSAPVGRAPSSGLEWPRLAYSVHGLRAGGVRLTARMGHWRSR